MGYDEVDEKVGAILQWQKDHERHDDARFKSLEAKFEGIPNRDEIKQIVTDAMTHSIINAGKTTKMAILTLAALIGALAIIGGGLKTIMGWIGLGFIGK